MKKVKIFMAMLFLSGTVATGFAQDSGETKKIDPETRAAKEVERLEKVIPDLTEAQKKQLREASLAQHNAMSAEWEEQKKDREEFRSKMKEMRTEKRNTYKEILTQEQYIQLLEKAQEREGRKGRKGKGRFKGKDFKGRDNNHDNRNR